MSSFNLTAEINLRGPSNLNQVVANIRRQLSTVSLNLNINPNAIQGIQTATSRIQTLNAALQTASANAGNLNAALASLGATIGNAASGMNNLGSGLNNVNNQLSNAQRNANRAAGGMEDFGRQSALAIRRFAAFSVATGGVYALVRAISAGYGEFLKFNKELVRLQQVTDSTASGLKSISDEITRLSTGFGVASSDLLQVSSTLAQAGLSATQTRTALEALAKSALAPSFDDLNSTVEGSIALMRQFGISTGQLEGALGSINSVAAAFAVEAGDIITAIQRTGGVFASASKGVSEGTDALNEFIAVFTSVRATTRESAETIATGLRTIFTRIQRGRTIDALKEFGITLTDLDNKFVGPYESIKRLSEGLQSLDTRDIKFSQIIEELGGFRQIGKVIPLIQQFATAQKALAVAQGGAGSLAEDAATAQLSLANKITKVREEFLALIRDIGQSQSFQNFVDISLKLASALISVASAAKNVLPALAAVAAIRAIPAIGAFARGFTGGIRRNQGGRVPGFASGGFVPGTGNGDTVPAMLTPGEFVIRKKAVQAIGVDRLQKMNRYAGGGRVQKFMAGGRALGSRGPKGFTPMSREEYLKWTEQIYAQWDADPSLPWEKHMGIPLPKPIAEYDRKMSKSVFASRGAGLAVGRRFVRTPKDKITDELRPYLVADPTDPTEMGFEQEIISRFGTRKKSKAIDDSTKRRRRFHRLSSKLAQAAAEGIGKSGSALPENKRKVIAPFLTGIAKDYELVMAATPRIRSEAKSGNISLLDAIKAPLSAFRKSGGQTSLAGVFSNDQASKIQAALPKYIESLAGEPAKQAKAKLASEYFSSFIGGGTALKPGHATAFTETINGMLKDDFVRFALGGLVQKFKNGKGVKKVPLEEKIRSGMIDKKLYKFGLVGLQSGTDSPVNRIENFDLERGKAKSEGGSGVKKYKIQLQQSTFYPGVGSEDEKKAIQTNIENSFKQMVEDTSSVLGSKLKISKQPPPTNKLQKILAGSPLSSVVGTVFEAALSALGGPFINKTERTKSIDFPLGLGGVAQEFGIDPNIPTDATRTIGGSGKGLYDMKGQIGRFIGAVENQEFTKGFIKKFQGTMVPRDQIQTGIQAAIEKYTAGTLASMITKDLQSDPAARKITASDGRTIIPGITSKELIGAARSGKMETLLKKLTGSVINRYFVNPFQPNAKGGSIEDTVPALLTPGEFVINKRAASRLGSNTLNKLNKADKISGFNKGGPVGDIQNFAGGGGVQRFALGGIVSVFSGLTTAISSAVAAIINFNRTTTTVTRNLAAQQAANFRAAGLTGPALKTAMINAGYGPGGINNMRTRNQMLGGAGGGNKDDNNNNKKTGGMGIGLMFIGPMIAEAINSSITKGMGSKGAALSGTITSGITGATIGGSLGGPMGAVIGGLAGLGVGFADAQSSIDAYTKSQNNLLIEEKSSALEGAFEQLAKKAIITADDLSKISELQSEIARATAENRRITENEAGGGFFGEISRAATTGGTSIGGIIDSVTASLGGYFGVGGTNIAFNPETDARDKDRTIIDVKELSKNLRAQQQPLTAAINSSIELGIARGFDLETILKSLPGYNEIGGGFDTESGTAQTQLDRSLAMTRSLDAVRIADIEARITEAGKRGAPLSEIDKLEEDRAKAIREGSTAVKDEINKRIQQLQTIQEVTVAVSLFNEKMKTLAASINKANSALQESYRQQEILTNARLGQANIVGPSRINENILENPTAYSTQQVTGVIQNLSSALGLDRETRERATTAAITQQGLEVGLSGILRQAAQAQKQGQDFDLTSEIRSLFDDLKLNDILNFDITSFDKFLNDIVENINKATVSSLQGKSLTELAESNPALAGLIKPLTDSTKILVDAQKSYNDMIDQTNRSLNAFTAHIMRVIDLQTNAATIQLEGANNLNRALGRPVTLRESNRPFETSIERLTQIPNPDIAGATIPGTGTTDPAEIDKRLRAAIQTFEQLQLSGQKANQTEEQYARQLSNAKLAVDRLTKAQEKLASDTTRASNALNRIAELRQSQEGRRNVFDQILSNLNNPQWMTQFVNQVGSLQRISSGFGGLQDIGPALEAFRMRISGLRDPQTRETEIQRFNNRIIDLLSRSGLDPGIARSIRELVGSTGAPDAQMRDAIDEYTAAMNAQKTATESLADVLLDGSAIFYREIIKAATDFREIIKQGQLQLNNSGDFNIDPRNPTMVNKGGLIYASKGQYVDFQPRGTDTVPAMLTPGEFVVNARATKKNLGLLQSINNNNTSGYSKGGMVYLADGGSAPVSISMVGRTRIDPGVAKQKRIREQVSRLWSQFSTDQGKRYSDSSLEEIYNDLKTNSFSRPSYGYDDSLSAEIKDGIQSKIDEIVEAYNQADRDRRRTAIRERMDKESDSDAARSELGLARKSEIDRLYTLAGSKISSFQFARDNAVALGLDPSLASLSDILPGASNLGELERLLSPLKSYHDQLTQARNTLSERAIAYQERLNTLAATPGSAFDKYRMGPGSSKAKTFTEIDAYADDRFYGPVKQVADQLRAFVESEDGASLIRKVDTTASSLMAEKEKRDAKNSIEQQFAEDIKNKTEVGRYILGELTLGNVPSIGAIRQKQKEQAEAQAASVKQTEKKKRDALIEEERKKQVEAQKQKDQQQAASETQSLSVRLARSQLEAGAYDALVSSSSREEAASIVSADIQRFSEQIGSREEVNAETTRLQEDVASRIRAVAANIESTQKSTANSFSSRIGFRSLSRLLGGEDVTDTEIRSLNSGRANLQGILNKLKTRPTDDELITEFNADLNNDGKLSERERNAGLIERNNRLKRAADQAMSALGNRGARDLLNRSTANTMVGINLARDTVLDIATSLLPGLGAASGVGKSVLMRAGSSALRGAVGGAAGGAATGLAQSIEENIDLTTGRTRYDPSASLTASNAVTDSIGAAFSSMFGFGGNISEAWNPSGNTILDKERNDLALMNQGMRDTSALQAAGNISLRGGLGAIIGGAFGGVLGGAFGGIGAAAKEIIPNRVMKRFSQWPMRRLLGLPGGNKSGFPQGRGWAAAFDRDRVLPDPSFRGTQTPTRLDQFFADFWAAPVSNTKNFFSKQISRARNIPGQIKNFFDFNQSPDFRKLQNGLDLTGIFRENKRRALSQAKFKEWQRSRRVSNAGFTKEQSDLFDYNDFSRGWAEGWAEDTSQNDDSLLRIITDDLIAKTTPTDSMNKGSQTGGMRNLMAGMARFARRNLGMSNIPEGSGWKEALRASDLSMRRVLPMQNKKQFAAARVKKVSSSDVNESMTDISDTELGAQIQQRIRSGQTSLAEILQEYASNPERAKWIRENIDQLLDIDTIVANERINQEVNAVTGKAGGVGGFFRAPGMRRYRGMGVGRSITFSDASEIATGTGASTKAGLAHELAHNVQFNVGRLQYRKGLTKNSLSDIRPEMETFFGKGGEYDKLRSKLLDKEPSYYRGSDILNKPFEAFTSLVQARTQNPELFRQNEAAEKMLRSIMKAMGMSRGGVVYASEGKLVPYQPRGTDTVPAMLTPGEFVVNAKAAKKNIGLLRAINGGARGYSKGGIAYLQEGGSAFSITSEEFAPKEEFDLQNEITLLEADIRSHIEDRTYEQTSLLDNPETFFYWALSKQGGNVSLPSMSPVDEHFDIGELLMERYKNFNKGWDLLPGITEPVYTFNWERVEPAIFNSMFDALQLEASNINKEKSGSGLSTLWWQTPTFVTKSEEAVALVNERKAAIANLQREIKKFQEMLKQKKKQLKELEEKRKQKTSDPQQQQQQQQQQQRQQGQGQPGQQPPPPPAPPAPPPKDIKDLHLTEDYTDLEGYKRYIDSVMHFYQFMREKNVGDTPPYGGEYDRYNDYKIGWLEKTINDVSPLAYPPDPSKIKGGDYVSGVSYYKQNRGEYRVAEIQEARREAYNEEMTRRQRNMAVGGIVYASNGRYINFSPKGTDTVPAMLTPGEFVVNKRAATKHLGLLRTINSQKFNNGGIVTPKYLSAGSNDLLSGQNKLSSSLNGVSLNAEDFVSGVSDFGTIINSFLGASSTLGNALKSLNLDTFGEAYRSLGAAVGLLSGSASGLSKTIGSLDSAITKLDNVLKQIPNTIKLDFSGEIPVTVSITSDNETSAKIASAADLDQSVYDSIFNQVKSAISEATNGSFKVNFNTSKK